MKIIKDQTFPLERALYGTVNTSIINCRFDGKEDGESALKECTNIKVKDCYFNLRYPMWHDNKISIINSTLTEGCRAALWYSNNITINKSNLNGIKAIRECKDIVIKNSKISSPEFGWRSSNITLSNTEIRNGDYLFFEASNLKLSNMNMKGNYSYQYIKNMEINKSTIDTKDAFWHSKNVTVKDTILKGQYLGWYSDHLTLINCKIIGTQPLCYCKHLKLINCEMIYTDLSFEYSDVEATIKGSIDSIKNPKSGFIKADKVNKIILEDSKYKSKCKISQKY